MLWLNGPILLALFFFLPETSSATILLRRAQRLRLLTGNSNLKSQSEIDQANLTASAIASEALWRPFQLMLLDPSIAFTAVYTAIIYGIFYSFFEAFPLVYIDVYGFNLGEMGLTFLSVTIGVFLSLAFYWVYIYKLVNPEILKHGMGAHLLGDGASGQLPDPLGLGPVLGVGHDHVGGQSVGEGPDLARGPQAEGWPVREKGPLPGVEIFPVSRCKL